VDGDHDIPWLLIGLVGVIVAAVLLLPPVRRKLLRFGSNMLVSVRKLQVRRVLVALCLAVLLTATYTLVLACAAQAVDLELSILQVFIVFSIGMLTATAAPTPGGLVGAEAGLFAGFVAYGVAAAPAGAAVLLYRLVSYWLPLIPGCFALLAARKRKLV
jgi:undecaprenyl-diphosphatase